MRPRNVVARDQLLPALRRMEHPSATALAAALQVAVPTVHKFIAELPRGQVVTAGLSRRTRYAAARPLRGSESPIPLYAVNTQGDATQVSTLSLVYPQGTLLPMDTMAWPVPAESRDGWWGGLPYPLYDMRPQGYLGRNFARREHAALQVPPNPDDWTDDDVVYALSRAGSDTTGNLILGEEAYLQWLRNKLTPATPLTGNDLGEQYAALAVSALASGNAGSSAAGEFPKFTAWRLDGQATPHVLVKFSGAGTSDAERRWADLLICEHLSLECATQLRGVESARTRIVQHAGRVFLEAERFDREGLHGRRPTCTLDALNAAFVGSASSDWSIMATRLHQDGIIDVNAVEAMTLLWWFGRLIGNTDMHLGNLSFHMAQVARLAPAYDMLPMMYAPLPGGEVPHPEFTPLLPLPLQREGWSEACTVAIEFWGHAGKDARISKAFQEICVLNAQRLKSVAAQV